MNPYGICGQCGDPRAKHPSEDRGWCPTCKDRRSEDIALGMGIEQPECPACGHKAVFVCRVEDRSQVASFFMCKWNGEDRDRREGCGLSGPAVYDRHPWPLCWAWGEFAPGVEHGVPWERYRTEPGWDEVKRKWRSAA
jgi:DNA-directed RNA polymerase subunit RPC12/RpoP